MSASAYTPEPARRPRTKLAYGLWILQGLLAVLFLFAGISKFTLPPSAFAQVPLPLWFLKFVGVCEALGGIGLILPALLRIRTGLTPLAAALLVVIMIGAIVITVMTMGVAPALLPLVVGVLLGFVAYGRWRLLPIAAKPPAPRS
jgi:uncharacterized membrane protein YphA (DoxX/SURF4 family)